MNETSLDKLHSDIFECTLCKLELTRNLVCVKRGDNDSKLFVIGEAPGKAEDDSGIPFVGDSGALLEKMWRSVGIESKKAYVTNIVKCHPPENRKPENDEIKACKPWLINQLTLIKPKVLVLLGATSYTGLIGSKWQDPITEEKSSFGITKHRGIWFKSEWCDLTICTFHPSYLLHNYKLEEGSPKYLVWQDWMKIKEKLDSEENFLIS